MFKEYSSKVKFHPWVGNNYKNEDKRLLILGESHYGVKESECTDDDKKKFTNTLIKNYCLGDYKGRSKRYWTNIMQSVKGKLHNEIDKTEFWSEVSFYNYIQKFVGETPKTAPTPEMWKEAEEPFFEVLEFLQPKHILVLSKRLWQQMTFQNSYPLPDILTNGIIRDVWAYKLENNSAKAITTWLYHPSYRFNRSNDHLIVKKLLELKFEEA